MVQRSIFIFKIQRGNNCYEQCIRPEIKFFEPPVLWRTKKPLMCPSPRSFCHCIRGIRCSFWRPSLSEGEVWTPVKGMVFAWISILICRNNINAQQARAPRSLSSLHSPTPRFTRWFDSYRRLLQSNVIFLFLSRPSRPCRGCTSLSWSQSHTHTSLNKSQEVCNFMCIYKSFGVKQSDAACQRPSQNCFREFRNKLGRNVCNRCWMLGRTSFLRG